MSLSAFSYNYNSYGVLGYINTPSGYTLDENRYAFSFSRNDPERFITFTASPFDWLDATIFYVDITKKAYGGGFTQSYKDKGFNIKLSPFKLLNHNFAIGFNDIAGTGLFQSEYLALSNTINNFNYTFGIGWGAYDNGITFKNPLTKIDNSFKKRSAGFVDKGGSFDINNYFSGSAASIFFAAGYKISPHTSLEFEIDPTNTSVSYIPYDRDGSKFNLAITQDYKDLSFSISLQRSNSIAFHASYSKDSSKFNRHNRPRYKQLLESYNDLQKAIEHHNIGLKEVTKSDKSLIVKVRQNSYYDQKNVDKIVLDYARKYALKDNFKEITVKQYYHGMEMNAVSYNTVFLSPQKSNAPENEKREYIVVDKYPRIRNNIYPTLRNYIASREAFYFGGLFLENDTEVIINNNIFILSNLKYSIYDNFEKLYIEPVDTFPEQVRSDNKKYFNNFNDGVVLGRLELNYFKSPKKNHYFRGSLGIFEEMFAGIGFDYVYAPEGSLFSFGFEGYHLRKRGYDMKFSFLDYRNSLFRASAQILEPKTDVRTKISFGEYIAGDNGYTLEFSKNFDNGVKFSAFFSKTNVSVNDFGEGSFDKGIEVRIPFANIFGGEKLGNFSWRPLTKDPAALLVKSIDLMDEVDRYRFY